MEVFLEALIYRFIALPLTLGLFLFWKKKKALVIYQAWALFHVVMNILLIYYEFVLVLSRNGRLLVNIAFFTNNLIVVYRSWQYAEKYMPKSRIRQLQKETKGYNCITLFLKTVIAKLFALSVTIKDGGNNKYSQYTIKKTISNKIL